MYQPWEIDVEVFPNFSRFYGNGNYEIVNKLNRYFLAYHHLMARNEKLQREHYANPSNKELHDKYCAGVIFEYRSRQRLMKLVSDLFPDYVLAAISKMLEQHEYDERTHRLCKKFNRGA